MPCSVQKHPRHQQTVADAAQRWLAVYVTTARSSKNVGMAAQRVRDYLGPFCGSRSLVALGPDDVREYRLWLQARRLAPRSVRHLLTDLRCLLHWAVETGALERSPFPRRVMPRIQEAPPDRLSDPEVDAIVAVGEPHAFVCRLALATGLRWGELCRADAAHLERGMLVVAHTKSARVRRVPVPPAIAREICSRSGRLVPYSEAGSSSFAKAVRKRSGVERFHVHQLRHTFACRWIEGGGTLPGLQQILGHASVVTTQLYARLSDESIRREAERVHGANAGARPRTADASNAGHSIAQQR